MRENTKEGREGNGGEGISHVNIGNRFNLPLPLFDSPDDPSTKPEEDL